MKMKSFETDHEVKLVTSLIRSYLIKALKHVTGI